MLTADTSKLITEAAAAIKALRELPASWSRLNLRSSATAPFLTYLITTGWSTAMPSKLAVGGAVIWGEGLTVNALLGFEV
jgi:hypothetical protein